MSEHGFRTMMMRNTRTRTKSASERPESKPKRVLAANLRRMPDLSGLTRQEREAFYAGAKFDTVPKQAVIPVPPMKWIIQEGPRSLSSPSSPITVSGKASSCPSPLHPIKLDVESLFGTKKSVSEFGDSELGRLLKSASVPDRVMMGKPFSEQPGHSGISAGADLRRDSYAFSGDQTVTVLEVESSKPRMAAQHQTSAPEVLKTLSVSSSPVTLEPVKKVSGISGQDLMQLFKSESPRQTSIDHRSTPVLKFVSSRCQVEVDHHDDSVDSHQYNKDITNHLKSILKVSITA